MSFDERRHPQPDYPSMGFNPYTLSGQPREIHAYGIQGWAQAWGSSPKEEITFLFGGFMKVDPVTGRFVGEMVDRYDRSFVYGQMTGMFLSMTKIYVDDQNFAGRPPLDYNYSLMNDEGPIKKWSGGFKMHDYSPPWEGVAQLWTTFMHRNAWDMVIGPAGVMEGNYISPDHCEPGSRLILQNPPDFPL